MRDIKFRAWDGKCMYSVDTIAFPMGGTCWYGPGVGEGISQANPAFKWEVDSVLMQYTGLKDKNGKEIYEGDIIQFWCSDTYWGPNAEISFGSLYQGDDSQYVCWMAVDCPLTEKCRVIGNIHENPELLDKE